MAQTDIIFETTFSTGYSSVYVYSDGTYAWVAGLFSGNVYQYLVADPTQYNIIAVPYPYYIYSDGQYCWVAGPFYPAIYQITISPIGVVPTITEIVVSSYTNTMNFITGDSNYIWMVSDNGLLQLTKPLVPTPTPTIIIATIPINVSNSPSSFSDGTYVWIADYNNDRMSQVVIAPTPTTSPLVYSFDINTPTGVWSDGSSCWVTNYSDNTVSQVIIDPVPTNTPTINVYAVGNHPQTVSSNGRFCFVQNNKNSDNTITVIQIETEPFVADTIDMSNYSDVIGTTCVMAESSNLWVLNELDANPRTSTVSKFTILPPPPPPPPPTPPTFQSFYLRTHPLYSDNSIVYYKPHSLASGGVGSVRNSRAKARHT
jgi:hypothetical protein